MPHECTAHAVDGFDPDFQAEVILDSVVDGLSGLSLEQREQTLDRLCRRVGHLHNAVVDEMLDLEEEAEAVNE